MLFHFLFILTLVTVGAQALPTSSSHAVHEARGIDSVHPRWLKKDRIAPDTILPVRISLSQSNLETAHEQLMAVSDPASPSYGKHWTAQEVIDFFEPSNISIDSVKQWLESAGISSVTYSENRGWLAFNHPAHDVESMLHAEYYEYEDTITGVHVISCDHYSVPKSVQQHVDYITPGLSMLPPRRPVETASDEQLSISRRDVASETNTTAPECILLTPDCIATLYEIPPSDLEPNPRNKLGIYEGEQQLWDQTDLNIFFHKYTNGRIPNGTTPVTYSIDGGNPRAKGKWAFRDSELMLDLEISYPIIYPQELGIWSEDDFHYQTANQTYTWGFNQLLDSVDGSYCTYSAYGETGDLPGVDPTYPDPEPPGQGGYNHSLQCGVYKPPTVLSASYSGNENDVPIAYQLRQCNEFLKLGLQGTTFLFATSDAGVAGQWPNGSHRCIESSNNSTIFNPSWPNTCPYVTTVASTRIVPGHFVNETQPEEVLNLDGEYAISAGGGFSNLYPIPDYQTAAVESYFTNHNPTYPYYTGLAGFAPNPAKIDVKHLQGDTKGLYNRKGRATPDVAANGWLSLTVVHGKVTAGGGTSQATPIFASIINRINEERLAAGKSPVGFINPVLYKNPSVLNDITKGSNAGCGTKGFEAAPGWDPASGLGTPNYPEMLKLFISLP